MEAIKLFLFGPPHLEVGGRSVTIRLRKAMALLIYLAVTRRAHSRDTLATMFWPESSQKTGRANLRRTLYRLNRLVGEGILDVSGDRIRIDPQSGIWVDVFAFEALGTDSRMTSETLSQKMSAQDRNDLMEAATLYAGDFMAGFTLPDCPQFDEWQFFRQEELQQILKRVLDRLAESDAHNNRLPDALNFARRRMALDTLDEGAQRRLMQLY